MTKQQFEALITHKPKGIKLYSLEENAVFEVSQIKGDTVEDANVFLSPLFVASDEPPETVMTRENYSNYGELVEAFSSLEPSEFAALMFLKLEHDKLAGKFNF